ncbi:MAG: NepR family anti-sigma factor [Hyphomicrobiaceae bacterium]|nr:NepR family anti-sigma factor [Hyphomicrobiaceae bacterium]
MADSGAGIEIDDPVGIADAVGRQIRNRYEQVLKAPVPSRFTKILEDLEASERHKAKGGGA